MSFLPEETKQRHRALFVEGGDSVGKNELVRSIAKYLLIAKPEQQILLMNFPQFWFFGHDIRLVLRGACDELLKGYSGVENAYLRSCLYAIAKLFSSYPIIPTLLQRTSGKLMSTFFERVMTSG